MRARRRGIHAKQKHQTTGEWTKNCLCQGDRGHVREDDKSSTWPMARSFIHVQYIHVGGMATFPGQAMDIQDDETGGMRVCSNQSAGHDSHAYSCYSKSIFVLLLLKKVNGVSDNP